MIKLHGLSDAEYIRLRYEFIKLFEGSTTKVYDDGIGLPTIGIGFNLQLEENLEALLKEGFGVNSINMGAALIEMNQAISDIETYVQTAKANGTYTASSSTIEMRKILTDHWRTFKSDPNAEFTLTDTLNGATVDDKIANVFDIILNATGAKPGYETIISQKMANVGVNDFQMSYERIVLVSLQYGGNSAVNIALRNDIINGNRFDAWYKIRYERNSFDPATEHGLAKRRYAEAELFGLFENGVATHEEAEAAVDGFISHISNI
jgi:GH24 family phage-related lysozyme (muramidase)